MANRSSRWALIALLTLGALLLLGLGAICAVSRDISRASNYGISPSEIIGAFAPAVLVAGGIGLAALVFVYFQLVVAWGLERRPATRLTTWLPLLLLIVPVGLALAYAAFTLDLDALRPRPGE